MEIVRIQQDFGETSCIKDPNVFPLQFLEGPAVTSPVHLSTSNRTYQEIPTRLDMGLIMNIMAIAPNTINTNQ